jgi:hypothetical protein
MKKRNEKMPENQKQHTPEFEGCINRVMKQGHEKGSAFAICTDAFEKAKKPIFVGESEVEKLHLFSESIKLEGHKVSGVCIHPKRIFHPEDELTHVYLKEELKKAAPTLTGKPFGIDHMYVLPPPNIVTRSWYDSTEDGVAYEGVVDDEIAQKIANKEFKGVSIELSWLRPGGKVEFMNGVAPRNFELTSVHLLRQFPPGDREAYIKFWNAITEQLVGVGSPLTIDDRVEALESGFKEIRTKLEVVEGKLNMLGTASASPQAEKGHLQQEPVDVVAVRKNLVETQAKLADAEKKAKAEKEKFARFHEAVRDTLPDRATELRWLGTGPKLFTEKVKGVLRAFTPS